MFSAHLLHRSGIAPREVAKRCPTFPSIFRKNACDQHWRSAAPILKFQRYQAGNRDGEIELADNRLQIGQAEGERIDRHDVAVTGRGQRGEAEIQQGGEFARVARLVNAAGLSSQISRYAEAKIVARFRYTPTAPWRRRRVMRPGA